MVIKSLKTWLSASLLLMIAIVPDASAVERVTYIHTDALGSPIAGSDANGNLVWVEDYRPYGEQIRRQSQSQKLWYTGKVHDGDTGLSYYGARWYDPAIGRFMEVDPVDVDPENIHSFNRYAYANNNPYKYMDPDGKESFVAEAYYLIGGGVAINSQKNDNGTTTNELLFRFGLGSGLSASYDPKNDTLSPHAARGDVLIARQIVSGEATATILGVGLAKDITLSSGNAFVDKNAPVGESIYAGGYLNKSNANKTVNDSGKTGIKFGAKYGVEIGMTYRGVITPPVTDPAMPSFTDMALAP